MKIRFRKNTIRFRLDQVDIENLNKKGSCEDQISIPPNNILFAIHISEDSNLKIIFDPYCLKLEVPSAIIAPMLEGNQVGFECQIPGTGDSILNILVERDFKCLIPRGEEDAHSFDNPMKGNEAC